MLQALTTPCVAVSQIMVEAYKKHILISLILTGKHAPLPTYRSPVIARSIKPLCQIYIELAEIVSAASSQVYYFVLFV